MNKPTLTAISTADLKGQFGEIPKPKRPILRPIHEIVAEQREPEWLIHKIIERNVLAILAGPRGTFKSFIALDWAMRMALDGNAGVILSGEGAGLDRRVEAWMQQHRENTDLSTLPLVALERVLNLNVGAELESLTEAIDQLPQKPAFIVIDTFSKFSAGLDENDNSQVASYLSGLSSTLREELNCTVLLVAHSGHADPKRPRGASSLMANPDCEYIVERPDPRGMVVTVSRERFKDGPALPAMAYEAKIIDLGRVDRYGEAVTSLALVDTATPPVSLKGRGRNQEKVIVALKEWARNHPDASHINGIDLTEICRNQKINRQRQREVVESFVGWGILCPAAGGFSLQREGL